VKTLLIPCNVQHVRNLENRVTSALRTALNGTGYVQLKAIGSSVVIQEADKPPQSEHKKIHKSQSNILHHIITPKIISKPDPDTGHYNPFPDFPYTGPLRPVYPLSEKRKIPSRIKLPEYAHDGIPRSEQVFVNRNKITILDKKGQDAMRKVCRMGREILDAAAAAVKPGVTTDYIDEIVHKATIERNVRSIYLKVEGTD
jgi:methionyl aminopeptidase